MEHKEWGRDISKGDEINTEHAVFNQIEFAGDPYTENGFMSLKDMGLLYKELEKESEALETGKDIGALLKRFHCTAEELQNNVFAKRQELRLEVASLREPLLSHNDEKEHETAQEKYFALSQKIQNLDTLLDKIGNYILATQYQPEPEAKKVSIDPDIYEGKIGMN